MRDGKQSESIPIPLRRMPSSSSTIAPSTSSHRDSNDSTYSRRYSSDEPASSIFSRSATISTCNSTINSSSTKGEALRTSAFKTSTRFNFGQSKSGSSSRLQAPQNRRRRRSFIETASQLVPSTTSTRGRTRTRAPHPEINSKANSKNPSPTSSLVAEKLSTAWRSMSKSSEERPTPYQNVNVHTECGRHSNDWLFGGFSLTGSIRKMIERKDRR